MRLVFVLLLLLGSLSSRWAVGQGSLTGLVRDSQTQKPLELAGVFLANTTRGVSTDAEGHFALRDVPPGRYTLVVSYLGYQLLTLPIVVAEVPQTFELQLVPSANQLSEIVVRPGRNRPADYALFKQLFLGGSSFARQCRIRNPDGVAVEYDAKTDVLTAFTPYQLQVDNEALGYRLTFYDLDFRSDFSKSTTRTNSQVVFEELPARNARQQRRWAQHRQQAYLGSLPHFLRSVYYQRPEAEGFQVQTLRLQLNQHRAWADTFLLNHSTLGHRALPVQVARYLREPRETPVLSTGPLPPIASVGGRRRPRGPGCAFRPCYLSPTHPRPPIRPTCAPRPAGRKLRSSLFCTYRPPGPKLRPTAPWWFPTR